MLVLLWALMCGQEVTQGYLLAACHGAPSTLGTSVENLPAPLAPQAYAAWLGFYNSAKGMGWSKPELVQQANRFAGGAQRFALLAGGLRES